MYKNIGHFSVEKSNAGLGFLNATNVRCDRPNVPTGGLATTVGRVVYGKVAVA